MEEHEGGVSLSMDAPAKKTTKCKFFASKHGTYILIARCTITDMNFALLLRHCRMQTRQILPIHPRCRCSTRGASCGH